jgi:hypothetical protein
MWTPTKSSNLDLAPGIASPLMDGNSMRHFTASVYAIFSPSLSDSHSFRTAVLLPLQLEFEPRAAWCLSSLALPMVASLSVPLVEEGFQA